jgi:hypothetical protein
MLVGMPKETIRRLKDKYTHHRRRSAQKAAEEAAGTDENKALIKRIEQLEASIAGRQFVGRSSENKVAEDDGTGLESNQNIETSDGMDCKLCLMHGFVFRPQSG